jgi:hypothetical protein
VFDSTGRFKERVMDNDGLKMPLLCVCGFVICVAGCGSHLTVRSAIVSNPGAASSADFNAQGPTVSSIRITAAGASSAHIDSFGPPRTENLRLEGNTAVGAPVNGTDNLVRHNFLVNTDGAMSGGPDSDARGLYVGQVGRRNNVVIRTTATGAGHMGS